MSVTPKQIWDELINNGASSVQAAGIMGNMQHESSFDPEANVVDSNGARSYGLNQWNAASYPSAASLVTGNPEADMKRQVKFLVQTGGLRAASGSTASQAGGNFAANYEKCQGCQSGGSQFVQRSDSAASIFQDAKSGKWPVGTSTMASNTQAQTTSILGDLNPLNWAKDFADAGVNIIEKAVADLLRYLIGAFEVVAGAILILIGLAEVSSAANTVVNIVMARFPGGGVIQNARQFSGVQAAKPSPRQLPSSRVPGHPSGSKPPTTTYTPPMGPGP